MTIDQMTNENLISWYFDFRAMVPYTEDDHTAKQEILAEICQELDKRGIKMCTPLAETKEE